MTTQPVESAKPKNGLSIAGLILGLIAVFVALFGDAFFQFLIYGALAVIFGSVGIARANAGVSTNKAVAEWALGLGIASFVIEFLWYLAVYQ